jgi:hypothetical protein
LFRTFVIDFQTQKIKPSTQINGYDSVDVELLNSQDQELTPEDTDENQKQSILQVS